MMCSTINAKITFVSAGAGSGKTYRLTELLHQELTGGQIRPSGVIATTFTKKAATELRERVREHLLEQGSFQLASALGQARIGTVNSICGQLIERFAFEAGVSTEQQVLDEVQASVFLGKAIDAVLDGPAMIKLQSTARRLGLEDWKVSLQSLVDQIRANDIPLERVSGFATHNADDLVSYFPKPAYEDLDKALLEAISAALPSIEATAQAGKKQNTNKYLVLVKEFSSELERGTARWSDWAKLSKAAPEAGLRKVVGPITDLSGRFAEHPRLHADVRSYLEQIFNLAMQALTSYRAIKREMGALDFADQEHQMLNLLDHEEVAEVLAEELDLLMVDEFQDTSPIQLALFLKLARFAKRVYWVGDIKQAIFGFRGSDTELMRAVLEAIPGLGGSKEVLQSSWRSRPELVRVVNAVFTAAFSEALPKDEVALTPKRADKLSDPALANWILGGDNAEQEASALAAGVRRLVDSGYEIYDKSAKAVRPVRYGDVAILSRTNVGVSTFATALSGMGIPVATAQPGLLGTPEATLALACLRRLNDHRDTLATAEIVSLVDGISPEVWVTDRLKYLDTDADADRWMETPIDGHPAHPLLEILAQLRETLPVLAPREAMQTVIAACRLPEVVVRWNPDPDKARTRLANLEALVELAAKYEDLGRSGQHAASVSGLILWLSETSEDKQDMLAEPSIDAVKILTNHAAKGLEWPVVVLTGLASDIRDELWSISTQSKSGFNLQNPLADRFIRYWPWPFGKQRKIAIADEIALTPVAKAFSRSAVEEWKRLLYVSMTRARDLLVLVRSSRNLTGEWIDALEAPWLLPASEGDAIALPSGEAIAAMLWMLDPPDIAEHIPAIENETIHWFRPADAVPARLPLSFNPSLAIEHPASVFEKCTVGERIPVASGADMTTLGTAVHECIALSFADPNVPVTEAEIETVLAGSGTADYVSAADVLGQIQALHSWIESRWPGTRHHAEIAVESILDSGQVLNGRSDLLLELDDGWILIDHKCSRLAVDHWDKLAAEYGAQIDSYRRAVEQATGKEVLQCWIFLPVAGGAIGVHMYMPVLTRSRMA